MDTVSQGPVSPKMQRRKNVRWSVAAFTILILALATSSAQAKCSSYINADGSIQSRNGQADCYAGLTPSRVSTGVYLVGVQYPLDSEIDEETGVYTYSFTQGICNASISDGGPRASSVTISPSVKPDAMFQIVPQGYDEVIDYTVRTFAATDDGVLQPADQDFTLMCMDWKPYEPMRRKQGPSGRERSRAAR